MDRQTQITTLLHEAGEGDSAAASELLPLVYQELRSLAEARMRKTPPGQTLQPTALVHEAYVRVMGSTDPGWEDRGHFFFAAARAMHDILVEAARRKASVKRGGDRRRVDMRALDQTLSAPVDDMIALSESLQKLEAEYPRKYRVVMLRFFAGLTQEEIALAMGVTERTVRQDWRIARTLLHGHLAETD